MNRLTPWIGILAAAVLAAGSVGCTKKTVRKGGAPSITTSGITDAPTLNDADTDAEPVMRGSMVQKVSNLETVHFDFDASQLNPEARAILAENAVWMKENPDVRIQVTGNCDQRGTVEYNLALGQRRAKSVRDYYRTLGIPGGRVATISYGEEKLLCEQDSEACWQKNRRGETLVAFPEDVTRGR